MVATSRRQFMGNALRVAGSIPLVAARAAGACDMTGPPAASKSAQVPASRPLVVDLHVHLSDPAEEQKGRPFRAVLFKPFLAVYDGNGNRLPNPKKYSYLPEQIIQRMNEGGIDVSFVMAGGGTRTRRGTPTSDEYLAEQIQKYSNRLLGVSRYDPLEHEWRGAEFVEYVTKLGFRGIKLSSPYDKYDPYDERLWPLYEKAIERDIVLIFHTGWAPLPNAPIKWAHVQIDGLDQVGIRYPELKVHLAHAGGPSRWTDAVLVAAKHENFSLDFSSWCTYPPQQLIAMLALARDVGGIDKVMFGSEHSICDPGMFLSQIRNINLWADRFYYARFIEEEISKILGLNAARKWKLSTSPRI